jgi:hypothetical protein
LNSRLLSSTTYSPRISGGLGRGLDIGSRPKPE